jgi:adenylyltransferase/sulfurtransferase
MPSHTDIPFSRAELARYDRHFVMPEFGFESQQKLKAAKVLVVGAGGLGSPLLLYLAAAGVGTIGIADFDTVDDSNLQRQVLFGTTDVGRLKTEAARERLTALNPHIDIRQHPARLTAANAFGVLQAYDVVADGSDNFPTRYLVNDACVLLGKTCVYAAVSRFEGQVSVFNHPERYGGERGPNYRDLHAAPPPPDAVPDCTEAGVLGVVPGIIGSIQALEVIKVITGAGETLSGRLLVFDGLRLETRVFRIRCNGDNPLTGRHPSIFQLIDYDAFCGLSHPALPLKEVTLHDLLAWQENGQLFQLIDVREPREHAQSNIGGESIPLAAVAGAAGRLPRNRNLVFYCRSGARSARAIRQLEDTFGFENLYQLKGGLSGIPAGQAGIANFLTILQHTQV